MATGLRMEELRSALSLYKMEGQWVTPEPGTAKFLQLRTIDPIPVSYQLSLSKLLFLWGSFIRSLDPDTNFQRYRKHTLSTYHRNGSQRKLAGLEWAGIPTNPIPFSLKTPIFLFQT